MMQFSTRAEAADQLRGQAASCRRLALTARTLGGSEALQTVAHQFDADASRIDPAVINRTTESDAASLLRVQQALKRQTLQWLQPRREG